jgi:hypothetical protein
LFDSSPNGGLFFVANYTISESINVIGSICPMSGGGVDKNALYELCSDDELNNSSTDDAFIQVWLYECR